MILGYNFEKHHTTERMINVIVTTTVSTYWILEIMDDGFDSYSMAAIRSEVPSFLAELQMVGQGPEFWEPMKFDAIFLFFFWHHFCSLD